MLKSRNEISDWEITCLKNKIRLIIVDDHPIFSNGLTSVIQEEKDFECVGQAKDGVEAINLSIKLQPDVVLMDYIMPKLNGAQATREIHKYCPKTAVLIISAFDLEAYVVDSLRAGASGYISKGTPLENIFSAIRLVHGGHNVFDIWVIEKIMNVLPEDRIGNNLGNNLYFNWLSNREIQVLNLVGKGMTNKEIAGKLNISEGTIQAHLITIYRKLGTTSRTQAIIHALREGWIKLEDKSRKTD